MKVSPVMSSPSTVGSVQSGNTQASRIEAVRSLRMQTNVTPGRPELSQSDLQTGQLSIQDASETSATQEATQPISPQFAELAKRRRALQVKERELADREKALATSSGKDVVDLARLKSQPLNVLLEAGVTYDQLTEAILSNQGNSEIAALKAELAALKEGVDKRFVDNETNAERQVLAEMRKEASQLVEADDNFELVRATRSVPQVMDLIERTYRKTGEVLDVREACQLVEDYRMKEAQKLTALKKLQNQFSQPLPAQAPRQPQMRTLTNRDTASVPLSRTQRALLAFQGLPIKR